MHKRETLQQIRKMGKNSSDKCIISDFALQPSLNLQIENRFQKLSEQAVHLIPVMQIPSLTLAPASQVCYTPKLLSPVDQTIDVAYILAYLPQIHEQKTQQEQLQMSQQLLQYKTSHLAAIPPKVISAEEAKMAQQQADYNNRVLRPLLPSMNQDTTTSQHIVAAQFPAIQETLAESKVMLQQDFRIAEDTIQYLENDESGRSQNHAILRRQFGSPLQVQTQDLNRFHQFSNVGGSDLLAIHKSASSTPDKFQQRQEFCHDYSDHDTSTPTSSGTESPTSVLDIVSGSLSNDMDTCSNSDERESIDKKRKSELVGCALPFKKRKLPRNFTCQTEPTQRKDNNNNAVIERDLNSKTDSLHESRNAMVHHFTASSSSNQQNVLEEKQTDAAMTKLDSTLLSIKQEETGNPWNIGNPQVAESTSESEISTAAMHQAAVRYQKNSLTESLSNLDSEVQSHMPSCCRPVITPIRTSNEHCVGVYSPMSHNSLSSSSPSLLVSPVGYTEDNDVTTLSSAGSSPSDAVVKKELTCFIRHRSQNIPKEKTFRCTHENCDKAYAKAAHLKSHMRIHTGKSPLKIHHFLKLQLL